jgi:hypothetical protein
METNSISDLPLLMKQAGSLIDLTTFSQKQANPFL